MSPRPAGTTTMAAQGGNAAAEGAADWLRLAAAPTFAIMALLTGVLGGGPADMLCSSAQDASPLSGMALMYWLMSVFHSATWLKLISRRRSGAPAAPDPAFAGASGAEPSSRAKRPSRAAGSFRQREA
jgi:hypothetical protein